MINKRDPFISELLQDAAEVSRTKGVIHALPYYLVIFIALGSLAAYFTPIEFFAVERWDVSATVYSGILAFNAITLALSWSAIGRVLEIMSNPGFSSFLQSSGMLKTYRFYVSFIHITQVAASAVTFAALITIMLPVIPIWGEHIMLSLVVGFTLWALRWSLGAVRIVSDLVDSFATFDGLNDSQKQALRIAVNNDI